jgi:hypothetical protein
MHLYFQFVSAFFSLFVAYHAYRCAIRYYVASLEVVLAQQLLDDFEEHLLKAGFVKDKDGNWRLVKLPLFTLGGKCDAYAIPSRANLERKQSAPIHGLQAFVV